MESGGEGKEKENFRKKQVTVSGPVMNYGFVFRCCYYSRDVLCSS